MTKLRRSAGAVGLATLITACGGAAPAGGTTAPPPGSAVVVEAKNVVFTPKSVTISAGQTVAWRFADAPIAHNVTGDGWHSADRTSGLFTHTFTVAGTYTYRCTIHTGMDGQVVVTP
ncbi:MAG: plastocyanin/azurin family copper-binding protein [Actinomycetota bacterium]|nr:plastocyanin/azurin family copper-binding protein [Actinomycetota bacterium]